MHNSQAAGDRHSLLTFPCPGVSVFFSSGDEVFVVSKGALWHHAKIIKVSTKGFGHPMFPGRDAPAYKARDCPLKAAQAVVCLSVYLSVCLNVCLSVCLSVYLSISICLSVCLSVAGCVSVHLSVCPSVCPSSRTYG